jgi:hypothetical protein
MPIKKDERCTEAFQKKEDVDFLSRVVRRVPNRDTGDPGWVT